MSDASKVRFRVHERNPDGSDVVLYVRGLDGVIRPLRGGRLLWLAPVRSPIPVRTRPAIVLDVETGRWYEGEMIHATPIRDGSTSHVPTWPAGPFVELPPGGWIDWFGEHFGYVPGAIQEMLELNGLIESPAPAAETPTASPTPAPAKPNPARERAEDRALLALMRRAEREESTAVADIAQEVKCSNSYLHRCQRFKKLKATLESPKLSPPRGRKSRDTRDVEAWEEDD